MFQLSITSECKFKAKIFEGPPNFFKAFYLFQVPIYGENMHFRQKMVEKILSKFLKYTISDVFLSKNTWYIFKILRIFSAIF